MAIPRNHLTRLYENVGGTKPSGVPSRQKTPLSAPRADNPSKLAATPFRTRVCNRANVGGKIEKHEVIDHLLVGEIYDAYFKDLTRFEEVKLTYEGIGFEPATVFDAMKVGETPLFNTETTRWNQWPTAYSKDQKSGSREETLAKCINGIGRAVAASMKKDDAPRKWSSKYCNTEVPYDRCKRKPDLVLMNAADADAPDTNKGWSSIFAVAELKSGEKSGDPLEQLAQSVRLIFGAQPDRTCVLGFTVHQDLVSFAVFTRSGVFASDKFNVHQNPERLIRVVAGMMFADRLHIGFDPTMKFTPFDETESFTPYTKVNDHKYEIVELLHVEGVIRGRATVCFKVKQCAKSVEAEAEGNAQKMKEQFFVVKNGWVDHERTKEPDILAELQDVPGIPRVFEAQVLKEGSQVDFCNWLMLPASRNIDTSLLRKRMETRKQVRVVISPFGSTILDFRSLKELVHGFITIVEAIEELHKKKYLHRDISLRNVLLDDETLGELRNGLLIDFDYAIEDIEGRTPASTHRTGTLPFMAIELLTALGSIKHEYYHDLESLFYVLCYICCVCAGSGGVLRENFDIFQTNINKWYGKKNQTDADIGRTKLETVGSTADFNGSVLSAFHKHFEPLKPFLRELRLYAIPPHPYVVDAYREDHGLSEDDDVPLKLQYMDKRKAPEYFTKYKDILREAFNSLPDRDPACEDDASTQAEANASTTNAPRPSQTPSSQIPPPQKSNILQVAEDVPLRLIDLIGPDPDENVDGRAPAVNDNSGDVANYGNKVADLPSPSDASNTLFGSGSPSLGKRKSSSFEEDEEDADSEPPKTPTPSGRRRNGRVTLPVDNIRMNPPSLTHHSRPRDLTKIMEVPELEQPAEIKSSHSANKRQKTS